MPSHSDRGAPEHSISLMIFGHAISKDKRFTNMLIKFECLFLLSKVLASEDAWSVPVDFDLEENFSGDLGSGVFYSGKISV